MIIDWHSHILPLMDDGSQSADESVEMLCALQNQGVATVIATPHFFANEESVDDFLARRQTAKETLLAKDDGSLPEVLCGAEVRYYPGIAKMRGLERLTIEGTNILLLEMPMTRWTEYTIKELVELASARGLRVVMAHIERYLGLQDRETLDKLLGDGLLMQTNASFFKRIGSRRRALALLNSGRIHFIGSDCHNMTSRAPNIDSAYELIEKRFGENYVLQMLEYGKRVLDNGRKAII